MKVGDLVKVNFPYDEGRTIGIFMGWDDRTGWGADGYRLRASVFWDGEIYSTPTEQVEPFNESG